MRLASRGGTLARHRARRSIADGAGSILLEVMLAAVLVGLVVVPLATAFAGEVEQSRLVRQQASAAGQDVGSEASGAWEWGPRVTAAWWRPGPVLHVRISGPTDRSAAASYVGLWADGWLVEQTLVPADGDGGATVAGELQVPAPTWSGLVDREVVIRVRAADGVWGPPWRLAVAGLVGGDPVLGSPLGVPSPGPTVVAHRPSVGTSSLSVSWSAGSLSSPPFGLLFVDDPAVSGWAGTTLDGWSQWWWMEGGRSVDVYF